jgi:hypothetical protein
MNLALPISSCPHEDEYLRLHVNNPGTVWQQPSAFVFCYQCRGAWTADTLPADLLDRCLALFEGRRS